MDLPLPEAKNRKMLWEAFLDGYNLSGDVNLNEISGKFKFSSGQIKDAIFTAGQIAKSRSDDDLAISLLDLYRGCKAQSNQKLSSMAKKIDPRYTWEEIILPNDVKEQLKEISSHVKYRETVYSDWGFNRK